MIEHLTGPMGGLFALAFGTGATAGYSFAQKTVITAAKTRIDKLEAKLDKVQAELNKVLYEDRNR